MDFHCNSLFWLFLSYIRFFVTVSNFRTWKKFQKIIFKFPLLNIRLSQDPRHRFLWSLHELSMVKTDDVNAVCRVSGSLLFFTFFKSKQKFECCQLQHLWTEKYRAEENTFFTEFSKILHFKLPDFGSIPCVLWSCETALFLLSVASCYTFSHFSYFFILCGNKTFHYGT